jgi:hypothetical protein
MGNKVIYRVFYRFLLAMIAFLSSFGLGGAEQGKGFQHKGAEIVVIGNERIDTSTIISYMGFPSTGLFTDDAIDNALKTLYATDLFSDVRVVKNVRGIVVNVRENPILNKVVLEGNKNLKDKFLVDLLLSKPLMTFSKLIRGIQCLQSIINRIIRKQPCARKSHIRNDSARINPLISNNDKLCAFVLESFSLLGSPQAER